MVEADASTPLTLPVAGSLLRLEQGGGEPALHAALVVGVDRSPASMAALTKAAELGRRLGADLHVVHAVDLSDYPVDPDAFDWEDQAAKSIQGERQAVSVNLADYPHPWVYVALRADPAEALNRAADDCDALMIVVGVRSTGWRHLLEGGWGGAVSGRLVGHCHRPVLLVAPNGS